MLFFLAKEQTSTSSETLKIKIHCYVPAVKLNTINIMKHGFLFTFSVLLILLSCFCVAL